MVMQKGEKNKLKTKLPKEKLPNYTYVLKSRFFGRSFIVIGIVLLLAAVAAIALKILLTGQIKGIALLMIGLLIYLVFVFLLILLPIRRMNPVNSIFLIIMVAAISLITEGLASTFSSSTFLGILVATGVLSMMIGVAGSAGTEENLTYFWILKRIAGVVLIATGHLFIMKRVFFTISPWLCLLLAMMNVMIYTYNVLWAMDGYLVELSENEYVAAAISALTFLEYPLMIIDRTVGLGKIVKEGRSER